MMKRTISQHPLGGHVLWFWPHYSAVLQEEWPWVNFSPLEMRCHRTGRLQVSPAFMDKVQAIRTESGFPFIVTSGWRSPAYNRAISHTQSLEGPHPDSQAIDIAISRYEAFDVQRLAMNAGFTGIGSKQHGDRRFLHLDMWWKRPRGTVWTYPEE